MIQYRLLSPGRTLWVGCEHHRHVAKCLDVGLVPLEMECPYCEEIVTLTNSPEHLEAQAFFYRPRRVEFDNIPHPMGRAMVVSGILTMCHGFVPDNLGWHVKGARDMMRVCAAYYWPTSQIMKLLDDMVPAVYLGAIQEGCQSRDVILQRFEH